MQSLVLTYQSFPVGLHLPIEVWQPTPIGALRQADNLYFIRAGDLILPTGRRGRVLFGSLGTGTVVGLFRFYPRTGAPSTLAMLDNGTNVTTLHDTNDDGIFQTLDSTGTTGKRWQWVTWPEKNAAFGVNGVVMRSYNGASLSTVTPTGVAVNGPYITLWKSALWATKADEINYSVYGSEFNDATNWPAERHLALNDPQGGAITGLGGFGDALIAAKSSSLWRFQGDPRYLPASLVRYSDVGCIAPQSWTATPYGYMFVGREGVYLTDGHDPDPLEVSLPIRSVFVGRDGLTANFKDAVGIWFPRLRQYWVKLKPTDTHIYVATRLDVPGQSGSIPAWLWSVYTNTPLTSGTAWASEVDDGRILVGGADGNVYTGDTGTTDIGTAYTTTLITFSTMLNNLVGRLRRVELHWYGASPITVTVRWDSNPANTTSYTLGQTQTANWQRAYLETLQFTGWGPYHFLKIETTDGPNFTLHNVTSYLRTAAKRDFTF